MSYQPPDGQFPNQPYAPYAPYGGAPDYGQPPYSPEGPTNPGPYAPPPPPGAYPPPPGPTAPYSGSPPPPPYQGQPSQALYGQHPVIYQPVIYQPIIIPSQDSGAAVAVEVVAGLFGFWGIGWLMKGYTSTGIIMLVSGLLIIPIVAIILAIATLGFGLPCLGVANIIVVVLSAVTLNNRVKSGRS